MDIRKKKIRAFCLLHIVFIIYSISGISSKLAAQKEYLSWEFISLYGMVLFILVLYAFLWQQVLKELPLVVAYANKAITVVWGVVWGSVFFGEQITVYHLFGILLVVLGILVISSEGKSKDK